MSAKIIFSAKALLLLSIILFFTYGAFAFSGSGSGTLADPFQVIDCNTLQEMEDDLDANYVLMNNIDCAEVQNWCPVEYFDPEMGCTDDWGFSPVGSVATPFTGSLDGGGYTISNFDFMANQVSRSYAGLFGYTNRARIFDLSFSGGTLYESDLGDYVAVLVGYAKDSNIDDCNVAGDVIGRSYSGGLVGYNNGSTISSCHATGSFYGGQDQTSGGLVGYNAGTISDSSKSGLVGGEGGGLVGTNTGSISRSFSLKATGDALIEGGLVTRNSGTIDRCYSTKTADAGQAGGLVSTMTAGTISNSYATGGVNGISGVLEAGGLVGWMTGGTISNSYATGTVNGHWSGGLVGVMEAGTISNSFAMATTTGTGTFPPDFNGAIVGYFGGGSLSNVYWNDTLAADGCYSYPGDPPEIPVYGSTNCTAIANNASYFYDVSNAPMSGWNFTTIWDDVYDDTNYPSLLFQGVTLGGGSTTYKPSGYFTSKEISLGGAKDFNLLNFTATVPSGTSLVFKLRSGDTNAHLQDANWFGPTSIDDNYSASGMVINSVHDGNSWVQWRAYFNTADTSKTPTLNDVNVLVRNKVDGNAVFVVGSGVTKQWESFTPTQVVNGGSLSWFYCLSAGCTSWTATTGTLSGSSSSLYLRCLMSPSATNASPSISNLSVTYKQ